MPVKPNVEALMRKHLGKETGDAILAKIDSMISQKKSPSEIQSTIIADIAVHLENAVVSAVIAKIGPITPIKVKPIQADVKMIISPIVVTPKINTGIQIKTGPYTKGSR